MRHACGAELAPDALLCDQCGGPVVWSGDRLETGLGALVSSAAEPATSGPAIAEPATSPALVPCTCGRAHPAGGQCMFGGAPARASGASVTLPGGLQVPLSERPLVLGRLSDDERVGVALDDDFVSRRHALVRFDGTVCWIADAGSTHGTWIDGRRVTDEESLPPGTTTIMLGTRVAVIVSAP